MSASGMMPPPNTTMSSASRSLQQLEHPREQGHVRAGQHRKPDRVDVLLDGGRRRSLRGLVQAGVDDLHAGVAQRPGDDLCAAVVAVEAGLGDDDADLADDPDRSSAGSVVESGVIPQSTDATRSSSSWGENGFFT